MDIHSTNALVRVVQNLKRPSNFLLSNFFPTVIAEESEEIHFDRLPGKRRIAPFVHPTREGKIVEGQGFSTDTFKPAYIKDKRVLDPNRPLRRAAGEMIGGGMVSPAEREQAVIAMELNDQVEMIMRRKEVMASEALRTGQVTVKGDGFATVVVSFGRNAALTITLSGSARWNDSAPVPLDNLEDWNSLVLQHSGASVTDVIMGKDAWRSFRTNAEVKALLDTRRGSSARAENMIQPVIGGQFKADLGNFTVWLYEDWYVDPDTGSEVSMFPANGVLGVSSAVDGVQHHGAIVDPEFAYGALELAPKSWIEKDPARRVLMMQSAPLVVPQRTDATYFATVQA